MANDCLFTKYIGSANNNAIAKKDCLLFKIVPTEDTFIERHSKMTIGGGNNVPFTVNAKGGAYFVTTQFSDLEDESKRKTTEDFTATSNIWVGNVGGYLEITNKYGLTNIDQSMVQPNNQGIVWIDLNQIQYCSSLVGLRGAFTGNLDVFKILTSLQYLNAYGGDMFGNIDVLADNTNLKNINIYTTGYVYGNIKSFGKNLQLGRIRIPNTSIEGTVEEFVKEQIANGRTSTTSDMGLDIEGTKVTFKGVSVIGTNTLSWTSDGSTATIILGSDSETIEL